MELYNDAMDNLGNCAFAEQTLESSVEEDPRLAISYFQLAALLVAKKNYESALIRLQQCWERAFRRGAITIIDYTPQGVALRLSRWHIQYAMAIALLRLGSRDTEAMALLCSAHAAEPNETHIRQVIAARSGPMPHVPLNLRFPVQKKHELQRTRSILAKRVDDDDGMHAFPASQDPRKLLVATFGSRSFYKLKLPSMTHR